MKYIKLFEDIDWEEDWEEEEDKKTITHLIKNQITINAKNLNIGDRRHLMKFLIDNNVNWKNGRDINIKDFGRSLGDIWCFIKFDIDKSQRYYIIRTDGNYYDTISVKELVKNFQ